MSETAPRVEVFLRSLAPTTIRAEQERLVDRLEQLEAEGRIKGVDYTLCGECVCPSLKTAETDVAKLLLDRYQSFEEWAETSGRELVGFRQRDTKSLLTGTTVTGIVFPQVALVEYRDGDLTFVAPSTNGSEQTSVFDRLDTY